MNVGLLPARRRNLPQKPRPYPNPPCFECAIVVRARGSLSRNLRRAAGRSHFRAHERKRVSLAVGLVAPRLDALDASGESQATVVDISLAGAAVESEKPLVPGERVTLS